jgi:hypothetical protein
MQYMNGAPAIGATDGRLRLCGERRLMLAVLEDALRTVTGARLGRTNVTWLQRELAWFLSGDRSHPFAFECICDALDIDADWLRGRALDGATRLTRGEIIAPASRERCAAEAVA